MAQRVTFHLTPEPVWSEHRGLNEYQPEGFNEEGFVHCTHGEALVLEVANRYYKDDSRPFLLLEVDLDQVSAPAIYEDDERLYPHIYGPIERQAVQRVHRLERTSDGTFSAIGALAPEHLP
jgi:uncharacterized protein (DUF952 family)